MARTVQNRRILSVAPAVPFHGEDRARIQHLPPGIRTAAQAAAIEARAKREAVRQAAMEDKIGRQRSYDPGIAPYRGIVPATIRRYQGSLPLIDSTDTLVTAAGVQANVGGSRGVIVGLNSAPGFEMAFAGDVGATWFPISQSTKFRFTGSLFIRTRGTTFQELVLGYYPVVTNTPEEWETQFAAATAFAGYPSVAQPTTDPSPSTYTSEVTLLAFKSNDPGQPFLFTPSAGNIGTVVQNDASSFATYTLQFAQSAAALAAGNNVALSPGESFGPFYGPIAFRASVESFDEQMYARFIETIAS